MSIVGNTYLEYGVQVTIVAQWRTESWCSTGMRSGPSVGGDVAYLGNAKTRTGPRNVLIRRGNGDLIVRPFRGLRKP